MYSVISAMLSDSGEYICIARNSRGQIADEVDLTVVEVIPKGIRIAQNVDCYC